jgi:hypothetical protein
MILTFLMIKGCFIVCNFINKSKLPDDNTKMKSKLLLHKEIEDNIYENLSLDVVYKPSGNLPMSKIKIRNFSENIYIEPVGSKAKKQIPTNIRNFRSKWIAKKIMLIIFQSTETGVVEVTPPLCAITKENLPMTSSVSHSCDTKPLFFFFITSNIELRYCLCFRDFLN